jgi:phage portal protein BeeE
MTMKSKNIPLLDLLNCPSPRQAGSSFMESLVGHLMLAGNAYIEAVSDQSGMDAGIIFTCGRIG